MRSCLISIAALADPEGAAHGRGVRLADELVAAGLQPDGYGLRAGRGDAAEHFVHARAAQPEVVVVRTVVHRDAVCACLERGDLLAGGRPQRDGEARPDAPGE